MLVLLPPLLFSSCSSASDDAVALAGWSTRQLSPLLSQRQVSTAPRLMVTWKVTRQACLSATRRPPPRIHLPTRRHRCRSRPAGLRQPITTTPQLDPSLRRPVRLVVRLISTRTQHTALSTLRPRRRWASRGGTDTRPRAQAVRLQARTTQGIQGTAIATARAAIVPPGSDIARRAA